MKGSRRILAGAASNWLRFLIGAVVSFILVPLMARGFGSERYGLWALASSLLGLLQSLDAGFGAGTVKWTAEARTDADGEKRNDLLSTALLVHLGAAVIGSMAVALLAAGFPAFAGISGALADSGRVMLLLLGLRVTVVGIPAGFLRGLLFGSDRLVQLNLIQIAASLGYGVSAWLLLGRGYGPVALAACGLAVALLELGSLAIAARAAAIGSNPAIKLSFRRLSAGRFKEALSFSGASFAVQIAAAVLMQSDVVVLKLFVPLSVVAGYGVAQKAAEYAFILVKQAVNALTPAIARLDPDREPQKARFFMSNTSKYAGALAMVMAIAAWILGADLLEAWAGPEFADYGHILAILATAFVILAVQMPCAAFLSLRGDHRWAARAMVASATLNILASLAMGPFLKATGIALGTLLAASLVDGIVLPLRAYRKIGMRPADLLRRVWFKLLIPGLAEGITLLALASWIQVRSLPAIFGMGLVGALAFTVPFWFLSMDQSERRLFVAGRRGVAT
jgi:O-antigen/teichoic acid export membrane protein